jgi:hypothetical protein
MDKKLSKICSKCNLEKDIHDYHKDKSKKDGYKNFCKECQKLYSTTYYQLNVNKIRNYSSEYYKSICETDEYKFKRRDYMSKWGEENIDKKKEYNKKYTIENKESLREKKKIYYDENKDKIKDYREINKERIRKNANLWSSNRRKKDLVFNLSFKIRNLISISIKKRKIIKRTKTQDILGCNIEEFKTYLESKFESWMSWDNHGKYNGKHGFGWDIDHIIPISSAISEDDVLRLNHYKNFQPLDSFENRVLKRNKLNYGS